MMAIPWQSTIAADQRALDYDQLVTVMIQLADERVCPEAGAHKLHRINLAYLNLKVQWLKFLFKVNYGQIRP